jgi:hypothetical protein
MNRGQRCGKNESAPGNPNRQLSCRVLVVAVLLRRRKRGTGANKKLFQAIGVSSTILSGIDARISCCRGE